MNYLEQIDLRLLHTLNGWAGSSSATNLLAQFLAVYGVYFFVAGLAVYWFLGRPKLAARKSLLAALLAVVLSRGILTELIRYIFPRPRPFLQNQAAQYVAKGNEPSFPSGHASAMFAIAFALYFYSKQLGLWLLAASFLVGIARVAAGLHFPSDILGGLLVGFFSAWAVERFAVFKLDGLAAKLSSLSDRLFGFPKR